MKCISIFAIAVCLVSAPLFAAEKTDDEGFVELFNGKDVSNFEIRGNQSDFPVKDGIIRCEAGGKGDWMLYKKEKFSDFVYRVEWRVSERGNSGVFIRAGGEGQPWIDGYEVQISCEEPRRDESHCTGALYGFQAVNPRPEETPEKWRVFEITCKGPHVTVSVDGQRVCELDQSTQEETKDKALSGYLGIQDSHGPAGTWVEYRSVKVKKLK